MFNENTWLHFQIKTRTGWRFHCQVPCGSCLKVSPVPFSAEACPAAGGACGPAQPWRPSSHGSTCSVARLCPSGQRLCGSPAPRCLAVSRP